MTKDCGPYDCPTALKNVDRRNGLSCTQKTCSCIVGNGWPSANTSEKVRFSPSNPRQFTEELDGPFVGPDALFAAAL